MRMAFTNLCLASVLHLCCKTGMSYLACICMYSFHWSGKENKPVSSNKRTVSSKSGKSGKSVTSGKSGKSSKPPPPQLPYIMANEFNNVPKWVNMKTAFSKAKADNCLVYPNPLPRLASLIFQWHITASHSSTPKIVNLLKKWLKPGKSKIWDGITVQMLMHYLGGKECNFLGREGKFISKKLLRASRSNFHSQNAL